ncbi:MAG: hypothetical protein LBT25_07970, partial [Candidatus Symbiothrix sp.]|nr:hypothetical protein [Candidatus Symbiothrix sp.]
MKTQFLGLCLLLSSFAVAQKQQPSPVLAFPEAEGFGRYTSGGRGGQVWFVDNLNDSGEGSLREAIQQKGARTIIFRISGTIYLNTALEIRNDSLTIAGQTAPGDGICLAAHPVKIAANDVIIRYMRFRMGDIGKAEDDALSGTRHKNIIIDHCSMSWSTDECASFYNNENFTLQWSILSESLRKSVHAKGSHGYGGIWGGMKATFHHNLLAHHSSRNPRFCGARYHEQTKETEIADFRNNVIYNWGFNSAYAGENGQYNMVNNYYKPGPATQKSVRYRILEAWQSNDGNGFHDFGKFYISGNVMEGSPAVTKDNWEGVDYKAYSDKDRVDQPQPKTDSLLQRCRSEKAFEYTITTQHTAQQAYEAVLKQAGASLLRDAIDKRIVSEVRSGTAIFGENGMIDSQIQVGGWPTLSSRPSPEDTDKDGIPDAWEAAHGLDKTNPADRNAYTLSKIYTNLEMYLNSLAVSYDIIVDRNGRGDFRNIQDAINSVRAFDPLGPVRIYIRNGVYKEKLELPTYVCNLQIIGESRDKTIITYDDHANINKMGTFRTYTFLIRGNDISLENLTVENTAEQLGQAVALHLEGDRIVLRNCRLLGNQDTIYTGRDNCRHYFENCAIEGTTDFIFGPSTCWFENCDIYCKRVSYITAASTPENIAFGYIFNHCRIKTADDISGVYLGRPWRPYAMTLFMNCSLPEGINPLGWNNWGKQENEATARYMEYNNSGDGAATGKRVKWAKVLTAKEAAVYTLQNVM